MNDHIWDINKVTNKLNHIKKDLQDYDKKYKGIIKNIYEKDNTNITKEYLSDVFKSKDEIEFCIYNKAYKQWISQYSKEYIEMSDWYYGKELPRDIFYKEKYNFNKNGTYLDNQTEIYELYLLFLFFTMYNLYEGLKEEDWKDNK